MHPPLPVDTHRTYTVYSSQGGESVCTHLIHREAFDHVFVGQPCVCVCVWRAVADTIQCMHTCEHCMISQGGVSLQDTPYMYICTGQRVILQAKRCHTPPPSL